MKTHSVESEALGIGEVVLGIGVIEAGQVFDQNAVDEFQECASGVLAREAR